MARGKNTSERKTRSALTDVVTREYTIHLHTKVHGQGFKHVRPVFEETGPGAESRGANRVIVLYSCSNSAHPLRSRP